MATTTGNHDRPHRHDRFIQAIAVFKFVKAILFVLAALGAFGLMQQGIAERAREWGSALAFTSGQHIARQAITFLTSLSPSRIGALGFVALFYAALFATEGIGLWRERRWAEYLTVIATGSLIPLEIWEIMRHPTPLRFATFGVNVIVVIYLVVRLRRPHGERTAASPLPNAVPAPVPAREQSRAG
jgi:uncharacterized membrane protein (DUF2068 family)